MIKRTVLFIILPVLACSLVLGEAAERVLTIDDSIQTGLHNSQKLLSLDEEISLAQQRINEARALTYPKIDLNLDMMQFDNQTPTLLTPEFGSVYLPQGTMGEYYNARVSLYQYLYAGGKYTTNLRVAEANLSQVRNQQEIEKNEVIRDVKKAFYKCLAAKKRKELLEKLQERSGALAKPKTAAVPDLAFEVLKSRHEYEKDRLKLLSTLGIELNTIADISGELAAPEQEYDLNKCLAWASQYRPELRQTQYQEAIDSLRVSLSMAERYPTVTLGANYERVGDQYPLPDRNWNAVVNVNLPIFDGWALFARIKQRKIMAREGKIMQSKIQDQVSLEVREAFLDYTFWKERCSSIEHPVIDAPDLDKKIDSVNLWIDSLEQFLKSQAVLEWAIGKPLSELK
jgi:outer membrane protein TolC